MTLNLLLLKTIQTLKVPLLVLAGGVIILYALGRYEKSINARDSKLDKQTKAALALHKKWDTEYKLRAAQFIQANVLIANARREARDSKLRADSLQRILEQSYVSLDSARTAHDSVVILVTSLRVCTGALTSMRQAYGNQEIALDTVIVDRNRWHLLSDSLHIVTNTLATALQAEHNARDCHFLFIKCPSRVTVAAVSVVTTVIGILVIKH